MKRIERVVPGKPYVEKVPLNFNIFLKKIKKNIIIL